MAEPGIDQKIILPVIALTRYFDVGITMRIIETPVLPVLRMWSLFAKTLALSLGVKRQRVVPRIVLSANQIQPAIDTIA